MGRRIGPDVREALPSRLRRLRGIALPGASRRFMAMAGGPAAARTCACAALALGVFGAALPALSQAAPAAGGAAAAPEAKKDRLLVEAKQLVYNRDTNVVSADGNVQLYYQGRVLEADKVIYDRNANRVFATGHAKLTEADGTTTYSDKFELTDDFKTGFVDSLSTITKDKTFFTSPRAERTEGETSTFEKGTYTACAPCAAHPERPPLWQVKAMKIVHKTDEQMIYFEDATLELYGVPIAYIPYFSTPDPTVTRKTGFLTPHYVTQTNLGVGVAQPFFWNLAPNYDLTLTPTVLSKQGLFGEVEWRHRLETGSYSVLATGVDQLDPTAYSKPPYGTGNRDFRGSVESTGKFFINPSWKYGWDVALFSDKYFVQDYNVRSSSLGTDYIKESISTAYLTGQGDRSYFNLQGYRIVGLSQFDFDKQQPLVLPTADYNRTFELDPAKTAGIGGELKVDANLTSLSRTAAAYQATGTRLLDSAFSLYDVCPNTTGNTLAPGFKPPSCFLRGIAGDYTRASTTVSYQNKYVDPIGEVWKPFAFVRADGRWLNLNESSAYTFTSGTGQSTIANADQANFFGQHNEDLSGDVVPGVGLEYRYPFLISTSFANQVVEPIGQIIVRPNVAQAGKTPNEDAQSLVFDDTTLFEWNKYSGYDRVEGGTRANAGVQYTATFPTGGYVNALFGQSYALAGKNSYAISGRVQRRAGFGTADGPVGLRQPPPGRPHGELLRRGQGPLRLEDVRSEGHRPDRHGEVLRHDDQRAICQLRGAARYRLRARPVGHPARRALRLPRSLLRERDGHAGAGSLQIRHRDTAIRPQDRTSAVRCDRRRLRLPGRLHDAQRQLLPLLHRRDRGRRQQSERQPDRAGVAEPPHARGFQAEREPGCDLHGAGRRVQIIATLLM